MEDVAKPLSRGIVTKLLIAVGLSLLAILLLRDCMTPTNDLPTVRMQIGERSFMLEVAATDFTRTRGLMARDSMPDDHGMIFVFMDERPLGFWMKNTRIPLDILYLDASGTIVAMGTMQAYQLKSLPSGKPARFAIELNAGAAARTGVKVGDRLEIPAAAQKAIE